MSSLHDRLSDDKPILLDGATGTELARRGVSLPPGLWSADSLRSDPEIVKQIHADYIEAGAEWITTNTFRTHRRSLAKAGLGEEAPELTRQAVALAREAVGKALAPVWVAGSLAPLEDCYRPEDVPEDSALEKEHAEMAQHLADAGVDLILVETQNTIREAVHATKAAVTTGVPTAVSFVCGNDAKLLSGESLTDAVYAVLRYDPIAILVNCLPARAVPDALKELKHAAGDRPVGVYANTGEYHPQTGWTGTPMEQPQNYAKAAAVWRGMGAKILGGCCGTTPEHIRLIRDVVM